MSAKSERKKITRHERRLATELGGRKTFASGAGDEKADGRVAQKFRKVDGGMATTVRFPLRIESKMTSRTAYNLNVDDWEKLQGAADRAGEHPVFHIHLSVPGIGGVELAVVRESMADDLGLPATRLWDRDEPCLSYNVSWARWSACGGGMLLRMKGKQYERTHHLAIIDYADFKNRIKESR
jgi:hypothetical protein